MSNSGYRLTRRRIAWLGVILLLVLFAALASLAFLHMGSWLVREDPIADAQFVVVLSGGLPDRAVAASEIFRASHAQEVWLTHPLQPAESMRRLGLPYSSEDQYNQMVLISAGVPAQHIRILAPAISNTADELHAVCSESRVRPASTVLVVTSRPHTRRVRTVWNRVTSDCRDTHLLVRASEHDSFDAEHWWRTTDSALAVVREYLGLLNAWAGLPLPHSN